MSKRILIVEDDPSSRKMLSIFVRSIYPDTEIFPFTSAEDAYRFLENEYKEKRGIHLAVIDIYLAGPGTGLDLFEACVKKFGKTRVLMTSSLSLQDFFAAAGSGEKGPVFLTKPYSPSLCREAISEALSR